MIVLTNERLNIFCAAAKAYINSNPKSKLWFACDKILRPAMKKLKKTEQEKNDKRRDYASTKDKGLYDLDERGNLQYTKENEKKLLLELDAIDERTVELETHIVTDFDEKSLSYDMRVNFEGIVIPAMDYETFKIEDYQPPQEEKKKE